MRFKTCHRCSETKKINMFYRDARSNDGYRSECKECKKKALRDGHQEKYLVTDSGRECSVCHGFKPWEEFYRCSNSKYGRKSRCRSCDHELRNKNRKIERKRSSLPELMHDFLINRCHLRERI